MKKRKKVGIAENTKSEDEKRKGEEDGRKIQQRKGRNFLSLEFQDRDFFLQNNYEKEKNGLKRVEKERKGEEFQKRKMYLRERNFAVSNFLSFSLLAQKILQLMTTVSMVSRSLLLAIAVFLLWRQCMCSCGFCLLVCFYISMYVCFFVFC